MHWQSAVVLLISLSAVRAGPSCATGGYRGYRDSFNVNGQGYGPYANYGGRGYYSVEHDVSTYRKSPDASGPYKEFYDQYYPARPYDSDEGYGGAVLPGGYYGGLIVPPFRDRRRTTIKSGHRPKDYSVPNTYFQSKELIIKQGSQEWFNWGYNTRNGPAVWPYYVPSGKEQSPINIRTEGRRFGYDRTLKPLVFEFDTFNYWNLVNNGRGFEILFDCESFTLVGGPSDCLKWTLHHIELHWGKSSQTGSLHYIDGLGYAAELVYAFYNKERYDCWEKAMKNKDGLLYVSVFVKICARKNPFFGEILKRLGYVGEDGGSLRVDDAPLSLRDALPRDISEYWTYTGSMPAPPLKESVTWVVLRHPITMSKHQLIGFRRFYPYNVRPVQKIHDRIVRASFTEGSDSRALADEY